MRCLLALPMLISAAPLVAQQPPSSIVGNAQCQTLVNEGVALIGTKQFNEALAKFKAAEEADPKASFPHSWRAVVFYRASELTESANVEPYRQQAEREARRALELDAKDPVALEVLRGLASPPAAGHQSTPEVMALYEEAERLFHQQAFKEAAAKYEAAFSKDPTFAKAILYAGDCYFSLKDYPAAETRYRRATELDPLDPQAWRFLADALYHEDRPLQDIEAALLGALAAQPNYMPGWARYSEVRERRGVPLKAFKPVIQAKAVKGKDGKVELTLGSPGTKDSGDGSAWMTYGLAKAAGPTGKGGAAASPFTQELHAWTTTFQVLAELKTQVKDATLLQFQAFQKAGDLEAAIYVFLWDESFRPDFEAWKKAHPGGLRAFLERHGMSPTP